jgi:hypothetical protein
VFLLVIGGVRNGNDPGITYFNRTSDEVELISFDPRNNPVPDQLGNMNRFPWLGIRGCVGGALSTSGKSLYIQPKSAGKNK